MLETIVKYTRNLNISYMKSSVSMVIVLMVGLLALVQPTGAVQAIWNANNASNIDNIWDSLGMSYLKNSSLLQGGNITLTKYANGSVLITSIGGSGCTVDCPNTTVASKESTWDAKTTLSIVNSSAQIAESQVTNLVSDLSTKLAISALNNTMDRNLSNFTNTPGFINTSYNVSYTAGGLPFSINNGTNVIETDYNDSFTTVYAGTITKLIAHSSQTGSINVSFWNATAGNTYISSVVISAGTDANTTLNYAFGDETRIMFNVTSVTDIKKVVLSVKTTKS